jgi:predicted GNAT family N-acyltransferase
MPPRRSLSARVSTVLNRVLRRRPPPQKSPFREYYTTPIGPARNRRYEAGDVTVVALEGWAETHQRFFQDRVHMDSLCHDGNNNTNNAPPLDAYKRYTEDGGFIVLALKNGGVVGRAMCKLYTNPKGVSVVRVEVLCARGRPDRRVKGAGNIIMTELCKYAYEQLGAREVELHSTHEARSFYKKMGFTFTSKDSKDTTIFHIFHMKKLLGHAPKNRVGLHYQPTADWVRAVFPRPAVRTLATYDVQRTAAGNFTGRLVRRA